MAPQVLLQLQRRAGNSVTVAAIAELQRRYSLNASSTSDSGPMIQRQVRVGAHTYSSGDGARDFRRELMLELGRQSFQDTGTKAMWGVVEGWLAGGDIAFDSFAAVVDDLLRRGCLKRRLLAGRMGPESLGDRPSFTAATERADLPTFLGEYQDDGPSPAIHRRHVISSSTLGRAIEVCESDLGSLQAWLTAQGAAPPAVTGNDTLDIRNAKRAIWQLTHNHVGNLFNGPGGTNVAIGLLRGPLQRAVSVIRKAAFDRIEATGDDLVPFGDILRLLPPDLAGFGDAEDWATYVLNQIVEAMRPCIEVQDDGLSYVRSTDAIAVLTETIRNLDLDVPPGIGPDEGPPPGASEDYMRAISEIYAQLLHAEHADLFSPEGTLTRFMATFVPRPG